MLSKIRLSLLIMATFLCTCGVTIGNFRTNQVHRVEVDKSFFELADKAEIVIPSVKNTADVARKIKIGDPVSINLGYIGLHKIYNFNEFNGFVKRIKPNVPLEIECEDAVWLLRQVNLKVELKNTNLKEILNYIVDTTNKQYAGKYKIDLYKTIPDIKFTKYRISNVNAASCLQEIKEKYGLVSFFRGFTLHMELPYFEYAGTSEGEVFYSLAWNMKKIPELEYKSGESLNIRLKAIAIKKDNSRMVEEVGDPNGELRTKIYYNIDDRDTLTKVAQNDLGSFKVDTYKGDLKDRKSVV